MTMAFLMFQFQLTNAVTFRPRNHDESPLDTNNTLHWLIHLFSTKLPLILVWLHYLSKCPTVKCSSLCNDLKFKKKCKRQHKNVVCSSFTQRQHGGYSVADPRSSRRGRRQLPKWGYQPIISAISPENCMKLKNGRKG